MNKETNTFDDFQPWETITLSNRYMFYKIFTHYPDKLHRLLEILLKIKIDHITPPEGEKTFETDPTAKSIRLDVYTKDKNRVYTVEMQNATESDLSKRARYYQGLMDVDGLKHGQEYKDLKENIVIFLCRFDPFRKSLPFYTFQNICLEDKTLFLNDSCTKLFINATAYDMIEDKEQKEFLGYLMHGKPNGNFSEAVDGLVEIHRRDTQWRQGYMTWEMELIHERNKAMQVGIDRGIEIGMERGAENMAVENAKRMILRGRDSLEEISEIILLPLERIQQIAEEMKKKL